MIKKKTSSYYVTNTHRPTAMPLSAQAGFLVGIVLLCALLLVFGVGKSMALSTVLPPVGPGSLNHPKGWCGQQGQPTCRISINWLPVSSEQPAEIAHAMQSSPDYIMLQRRADYVALDIPERIRSLDKHTGISYYDMDHWVASARSASGERVGLFDFVYDAASKRLRFSSFGIITQGDIRSHMAFPYIPQNRVLARLQSQPGVHLLAQSRPELVFFLIDPRYNDLSSQKYRWYGGGNSPMSPLWQVAGSIGSAYFVGPDMRVYTNSTVKTLIVGPHVMDKHKKLR